METIKTEKINHGKSFKVEVFSKNNTRFMFTMRSTSSVNRRKVEKAAEGLESVFTWEDFQREAEAGELTVLGHHNRKAGRLGFWHTFETSNNGETFHLDSTSLVRSRN